LSNAQLDTPWPKVVNGKADLRDALAGPPEELEPRIFASLARRDPAPEGQLPATGIDAERERALSSAFIATPEYGTRSSTVILIARDGRVTFVERTSTPDGTDGFSEVRHEFAIE
ncbi:MAG: NRDE family protein, partial [Gemmatimonadetes bacterium]|nr:NRDE family protein [Gemmatimonadota bacterium]